MPGYEIVQNASLLLQIVGPILLLDKSTVTF